MDLIDEPPKLDIYDKGWSIYSRNTALAPQYSGSGAKIKNRYVAQGCMIYGTVDHSVIFSNVEIGDGSTVTDSVIMPGVKIGKNVTIEKAVVGTGAVIEDGAVIGKNEDKNGKYISDMCTHGLVLLENGRVISAGDDIPKCSMVEIE